jgi:alpha-D-ribose 1-methylphosphonate 5-triphosphate synthase subunit PhnL
MLPLELNRNPFLRQQEQLIGPTMPERRLQETQIKKILVVHQDCFIPLPLSVNLLFKVKNITQNVIAEKAGVDKSMIYKSLAKLRTPPET